MSFLRRFHNIVSQQNISTAEKIQLLLKFGLETFDLEVAIVSEVTGSTYTILYVESENAALTPQCQFDLDGTYCVHTLKADKALSFHHAGNSEISKHPCYTQFKLESYIGAPIRIAHRTFGTINFSAAKISRPFTAEHIDYVELFAQWLGFELARIESKVELENNYKTLKKVEQVAAIGSWRLNTSSQQVFWSDEAKKLHGIDLNTTPSLSEWVHFIDGESHQQKFLNTISNSIKMGTQWELEFPATTKDNRKIWLSCHGEIECQQDQCVDLIGSMQDITKSVQLRKNLKNQKLEAEKLLNERSLLLAKISHEMRTPLNGINGLLLNSMEENDQDKVTENLQLALRSTEILTSLINEILDFSKISQKGLSLSYHESDITRIMYDIAELSKQLASSKGIKFAYSIDLPQNCWVNCDPIRLNQIITNLISNAIKFTDTGVVELRVYSSYRQSDVDLYIEVNDTGIGMSPASIEHLFDPFKQGENEVGSHFGGTGLGMSIVKELIELMQGTISVDSALKKGSQFKVYIPLKSASEPNLQHVHTPNECDASKLTVLVVEDNEINQKVITAFLRKFNITPDLADNGQVAIQKCELNTYDLIFMDSIMPIMDGLTATSIILQRGLVPKYAQIIAMTASTDELSQKHFSAVGMHDILPKPIDFMSLGRIISNCLEATTKTGKH
ncbi:ATP-binding protein [Pseudoalteromonas luteoviolacea]|uniref:ATP-binding protein n=1 Tax=Pseudoalteromonas luteoviolacea TaxID=43657 RepID=UPI00061CE154|nr:ATP-binding protein [Pseudoalteromonas luteoviolacea]